jgi:hypothetical protein
VRCSTEGMRIAPAYQWREAFVCVASENRETAMGAGVGWCENLAEGVHHWPRRLRQGRVR